MHDTNGPVLLSQREREVIALALEGLTTSEMAHTLKVSPATIKAHLLKIYRKSGVKRRVQLVRLAEAVSWPRPTGDTTAEARAGKIGRLSVTACQWSGLDTAAVGELLIREKENPYADENEALSARREV